MRKKAFLKKMGINKMLLHYMKHNLQDKNEVFFLFIQNSKYFYLVIIITIIDSIKPVK